MDMKNPYELDLDTKKTIKKSFDFWWDHLSESKRWFKDNPRIQEELAWIEAWVTNKSWEKYNYEKL